MIEISVCLITYNKAPFLERCIPAFWDSVTHHNKVELLVLDNGSDDGTAEMLDRLSSQYPLIVKNLSENVGLNGYGIITRYAIGDIVVTLDDDIFHISRGWEDLFARGLSTRYMNRKFGYVGSNPINKNGGRMPLIYDSVVIDGLSFDITPVGGWFVATDKETMIAIGGFHTGLPVMYLEDADYQNRVWASGGACGILNDIYVYHACAPDWYVRLGRVHTYNDRVDLAREVGIELRPIT